jgi:hypothetical protein
MLLITCYSVDAICITGDRVGMRAPQCARVCATFFIARSRTLLQVPGVGAQDPVRLERVRLPLARQQVLLQAGRTHHVPETARQRRSAQLMLQGMGLMHLPNLLVKVLIDN